MPVNMATSASPGFGTIALADLLNHLRQRVALSERDIAAATGADEATVRAWFERRSVPVDQPAVRLVELVAVCKRLTVSTKAEAIPDWLNRQVPLLAGRTPLATLAAGGYEDVRSIAEDLIDPPFTY